MLWIMLVLLALVIGGSYVRGAATRVRDEFASRKRFHISIKIDSEHMASRADLAERAKLETLIADEHIGEITESGSGGGWMDLVVAVAESERGEQQLREAIARAGFADRFELKPL